MATVTCADAAHIEELEEKSCVLSASAHDMQYSVITFGRPILEGLAKATNEAAKANAKIQAGASNPATVAKAEIAILKIEIRRRQWKLHLELLRTKMSAIEAALAELECHEAVAPLLTMCP